MDSFRLPKKLAWMPLVVLPLLGSCFFFDDPKEESYSQIVGFASDTTAILFSYNWKTNSNASGPGNAGSSTSKNYLDLELKLVDVRFKKVYWISNVKNDYGENFWFRQWNDSTIIFESDEVEGYWLWTIGYSRPRQATLNWNTEKKDLLHYDYKWLRWKDNSILLYSNFPSSRPHIIIDTKLRIVNNWSPTSEEAWVANCDDFWYGNNGGACLMNNKPYGFILLSEKGDTLSSFTYAHECLTYLPYYNKECEIRNYFSYHFIEASLRSCTVSVCETCPTKNIICKADYAYIRYDDKWNVNKEPSFWFFYDGKDIEKKFVDSLQNITRY